MGLKYPPQKVVAIDVDGTLIVDGLLNSALVTWCEVQKSAGYALMLWSARGHRYAVDVAEKHGVTRLFDTICSKPGYIVDDQGWGWIKHTRRLLH